MTVHRYGHWDQWHAGAEPLQAVDHDDFAGS
jgi:hypothetical protein